MNFWELLKEDLFKFEKRNKGKWFIYNNNTLKFDCIVFGIEGEIKAKFKKYDFMQSIEFIDHVYLNMSNMYMAIEVDQDYIEKKITDIVKIKLISNNKI